MLKPGRQTTHRVAVILADRVPLLHVAVPCAVFGSSAADAYDVMVCADTPLLTSVVPVEISAPALLEAAHGADTLVVAAWPEPSVEPPPALLELLRSEHQRGARIVGLCLGAFVLARAGLLDGRTATTHWAFVDVFTSMHPEVQVAPASMFVDHGDVVTAAGGAAGLDCCLHLVKQDFGAAVATDVARELVLGPMRSGSAAQIVSEPPSLSSIKFADTLTWALSHLDEGIDVSSLARHACVSRRTIERVFRRSLGVTPAEWLAEQRVQAAQRLLETTLLTVDEVAARTGFGTPTTLRRQLLARLGTSPSSYRRALNAPRDPIGLAEPSDRRSPRPLTLAS